MDAPRPSSGSPRLPGGARPLRALRILGRYARIGWIRKSQFRLEFFNQVVMDCVFYLTHVLSFEIVWGLYEPIAGWPTEDVRVLLGFYFVSDAFMMVWLGQAWHFGDDLKKGNLDPVRVRPASPLLLYFFQRYSPEGSANALIAVGYLLWGLAGAGVEASPATVGLCLWAAALACWARFVTMVLFSTFELWFTNSDVGRMVHEYLGATSDKPLEIWTRRVRQFFLYLVPMGLLGYGPTVLAIGRVDVARGLFLTAWLLALGWAICRFWRFSFRRYESAMG